MPIITFVSFSHFPFLRILACPHGWSQIDGQCLKVFTEGKSWADAEITCIDNGGHLATIGTQTQNDWIAAQATTYIWHGATDQFSAGTWTDALGRDVTKKMPLEVIFQKSCFRPKNRSKRSKNGVFHLF